MYAFRKARYHYVRWAFDMNYRLFGYKMADRLDRWVGKVIGACAWSSTYPIRGPRFFSVNRVVKEDPYVVTYLIQIGRREMLMVWFAKKHFAMKHLCKRGRLTIGRLSIFWWRRRVFK